MMTSRCLVIVLLLEFAFFSLAFLQRTTGPRQMLRPFLRLQMTKRRSGKNQSKRPQGNNALLTSINAIQEKQGATLEKQGAILEKQGATLVNLVGYNKNRDEELEVLLSTAFYEYLRKKKWQVGQIKVSEIYNTTGSPILQWDFIFFATHQDYEPTLFLGEAKQLAKSSHCSTLTTKVLKMTSLVLPGLMERKIRDGQNEEYKNFRRKFLKHMIAYPDCRVVGVLAYNGNEPGLEGTLNAHPDVSFVSRASGGYSISLRGLTTSNPLSKKQQPPPEPPTSQKHTLPHFHH